jgi:spore maturation protein CgeB
MFDPEKVKKYILQSGGQGDPGGVFVSWQDYKELLERYNLLLAAEQPPPAFTAKNLENIKKLFPFQKGSARRPENGQK